MENPLFFSLVFFGTCKKEAWIHGPGFITSYIVFSHGKKLLSYTDVVLVARILQVNAMVFF